MPKQTVIFLPGPAGAAGAGVFAATDAIVTPETTDYLALHDNSDSLNPKRALVSAILALAGAGSGISIVSVPATEAGTGAVGEFAVDSFYVYMCVATDTWVRWTIQNTFTS